METLDQGTPINYVLTKTSPGDIRPTPLIYGNEIETERGEARGD